MLVTTGATEVGAMSGTEVVPEAAVVGRSGGQRVSDAERDRVARRLVAAHGEGRLSLAEFDERVRAAHGAVVRADLEPLLADLPDAARPDRPRDDRRRPRDQRRPAPFPVIPFAGPCPAGDLRAAVAVWAFASVLNVVIWLAVVLGTGTLVHPWWIWVAGPWGAALLIGAGVRRAVGGAPGRAT
jgi:hypothetical protein